MKGRRIILILFLVLILVEAKICSLAANWASESEVYYDSMPLGSRMRIRIIDLHIDDSSTESSMEACLVIFNPKGKIVFKSKVLKMYKGKYYSGTFTYLVKKNYPAGLYTGVLYMGSYEKAYFYEYVYHPVEIKKGTLFLAKSLKKKTLEIKWKKNKDITGYQVYISPRKDFVGHFKKNFKNKTKIITRGWDSGKAYYIKVRPYKKYKKKIFYGQWSKVKKVKIK